MHYVAALRPRPDAVLDGLAQLGVVLRLDRGLPGDQPFLPSQVRLSCNVVVVDIADQICYHLPVFHGIVAQLDRATVS